MNKSDSPFQLANPPAVIYVDPELFKHAKTVPERMTPILDPMTEDDYWAMQEIAEMEVHSRMGKRRHFDDFSYSDR